MAAEPIIYLDGLVLVSDWEDDPLFPPRRHIALDTLVAEAVSHDMLEDEPLAEAQLTQFRERLFFALQHVDKALAHVRNTKA
jgi:hypothetical protein